MGEDLSAAQIATDVERASEAIAPYIRETPVERSPFLSKATGSDVYLKFENFQVTGSFKARGAFNALLSLTQEEKQGGVVTSSTGNHANAMAHALSVLGIEGEILLPLNASPAKIEALEARGANLRLIEGDPNETDLVARRLAEQTGRVFVSAYNDRRVIAGQGTVASELERQLDGFDAIFVPVGGGGLIAGIAGYLASKKTEVIGCQAAASPVMAKSVEAGGLVDVPWESSLSDATVGPLEQGTLTLPICIDHVDKWILPDEDEIAEALRLVLGRHSVMVEGAAVLSVAALLKESGEFSGRRTVLVISGSRIPLDVLDRVLQQT
ncbi:MAG: pyridoxal-phosphate dependent enzyme [Actinomycetota bacterium]